MFTSNKSRLFLLALALSAFFLTAASGTSSGYAIEPPADGIRPDNSCGAKCLVADYVEISAMVNGDSSLLLGTMMITDGKGRPIAGVSVVLKWTLPDGTKVENRIVTGNDGSAMVQLLAMQEGLYRLDIVRAAKAGFHFDHEKSNCDAEFAL